MPLGPDTEKYRYPVLADKPKNYCSLELGLDGPSSEYNDEKCAEAATSHLCALGALQLREAFIHVSSQLHYS